MHLLIAILAIFGVYELVYATLPWSLPDYAYAILAFGMGWAFCWPDWRMGLAIMGATGILHVIVSRLVSSHTNAQVVRRGHSSGSVPLP